MTSGDNEERKINGRMPILTLVTADIDIEISSTLYKRSGFYSDIHSLGKEPISIVEQFHSRSNQWEKWRRNVDIFRDTLAILQLMLGFRNLIWRRNFVLDTVSRKSDVSRWNLGKKIWYCENSSLLNASFNMLIVHISLM